MKMRYIFCFLILLFPILLNAQWERTNGPWGGVVYSIIQNKNEVIAGTDNGIYISTNKGQNWYRPDNGGQEQLHVHFIAAIDNIIYIDISGGLLFSTDNGNSWDYLHIDNNIDIGCLTSDSNYVYLGANTGFYILDKNGKILKLINNYSFGKILSIYFINNEIYLGTAGNGIFYSSDKGENWNELNNGFSDWMSKFVYDIAKINENIYIGTDSGIFISKNNGDNWELFNNGLPKYYFGINKFFNLGLNLFVSTTSGLFKIDINILDNNWEKCYLAVDSLEVFSLINISSRIFAATRGLGVFYSDNLGDNWYPSNTGLNEISVNDIIEDNNNLIAGTTGGIFISSNNGANWESSNKGLSEYLLATVKKYGQTLYIITWGGKIFISENHGLNWYPILKQPDRTVTSLCLKDSLIFCGTWGGGIYISDNMGKSWKATNNGITSLHIRDLATDGQNIYGGSWEGLIFSSDNGTTWEVRKDGLIHHGIPDTVPDTDIFTIGLNMNKIYAGTWGSLFSSTNQGINWKEEIASTYFLINSFAFKDNFIFTGNYSEGIVFSNDNGANWRFLNEG